jgi:excisionase family DNA binding protein
MNHTNPALYAELSQIVADAVSRALLQVIQQAREGRGRGDKDKPQPPKIGYSMKEAARVSGVGRTTLYAALRLHELRSVKKGARRIILHRDLQRWLEGLPPSNV